MADLEALDGRIQQINQKFKAAQLGVQIERRGQKLNLRGTFPPKPDSPKLNPYQQRIPLGFPASAAGLKQAEQEAKIIAGQVLQNMFTWEAYRTIGGKRLHHMNLPEQISAFEQAFSTEPSRLDHAASTKTTWQTAYAPYLRKLSAIAETHPNLTIAEAIYKAVESTPVNSRSRQLCCTTFSAFAQFLKLDLPKDLKTYWGHYSATKTQSRQLPSDTEIVETWAKIPNPAWQFVYGLMAAYGLRNHEVFFCDFSHLLRGDAMIEVLPSTKTGSHMVWPFHPDWVETFNLRSIHLPDIATDLNHTTLQRIGQRVTAQFRRYAVPFSPYDLRHAWAVRTIHFGIPDTVAAKMMGHSVAIHTRTYHQWITLRDQQQAVEAALKRHDSK